MDAFLRQLVGLVVWLVSVAVYLDARRRGRRGFTRFVAFWVGFPATWISWLVVREGTQPDIQPPPDDEMALLEEIRRDRDTDRSLPSPGAGRPDEEAGTPREENR